MRIAIGSDHRGYHLKEQLIALLRSKGHEVEDEGARGAESVDYPDFAALVAKKVSGRVVERTQLIWRLFEDSSVVTGLPADAGSFRIFVTVTHIGGDGGPVQQVCREFDVVARPCGKL